MSYRHKLDRRVRPPFKYCIPGSPCHERYHPTSRPHVRGRHLLNSKGRSTTPSSELFWASLEPASAPSGRIPEVVGVVPSLPLSLFLLATMFFVCFVSRPVGSVSPASGLRQFRLCAFWCGGHCSSSPRPAAQYVPPPPRRRPSAPGLHVRPAHGPLTRAPRSLALTITYARIYRGRH